MALLQETRGHTGGISRIKEVESVEHQKKHSLINQLFLQLISIILSFI